jgi:hypothetical protein
MNGKIVPFLQRFTQVLQPTESGIVTTAVAFKLGAISVCV